MKIPTLKLPNVESKAMPTPYSNVTVDTGAEAIAKGLGDAEQAVGEIGRHVMEAKRKADAMQVADAMAQYQQQRTTHAYGSNSQRAGDAAFAEDLAKPEYHGGDPNEDVGPSAPDGPPDKLDEQRTNGYLNTRGKKAAVELDPALEDLQKSRHTIASGLANNEQKREFLRRSQQLFQESFRQYHEHTSTQLKMAEEASQKANEAAAITSIANNYSDPKEAAVQTQQIAEQLRAFSLSKEDGDGKVAAWESTVTETRLNQFIANHDFKGAQTLFASEGKRLGARSAHFENIITEGREDAEAQMVAGSVVNEATDPNSGHVSYAVALAKLGEKLKANDIKDPRFVKAATTATEEAVAHAETAWRDTAQNVSRQAYGDYNIKGWAGMDPSLKVSLNKYNPDLYDRLANEQKRKVREALMNAAELAKLQADANTNLMYQFHSLSPEQRSGLEVDTWAAGTGANTLGVNAVKAAQEATKESLAKGDGEHEKSFVDQVAASLQGTAKTKEQQATVRAEATNRYYDWKRNHDGKAPNDKEAEDILVAMKKRIVTKGFFFESEKMQYEVDAEQRKKENKGKPPAPAAKSADDGLLFQPKVQPKSATAVPVRQAIGPKGQKKPITDPKAFEQWLRSNPNSGWKLE